MPHLWLYYTKFITYNAYAHQAVFFLKANRSFGTQKTEITSRRLCAQDAMEISNVRVSEVRVTFFNLRFYINGRKLRKR